MNENKPLPAAARYNAPCGFHDPPSSHHMFSGAFDDPCVLVFERRLWIPPTDEQLAEYERKRAIVESLDGKMRALPWEIAGKNHPLSSEDVEGILRSVRADYPHARIVEHWNGEGCYTMSVKLSSQGEPDGTPPQANPLSESRIQEGKQDAQSD